ncbi:hypothetical protein BGZ76_009747 [Entomortierella beljakovae]|nr:hypothetical protein BGZ76_009747 [Entomortierella beljakovae]
MPEAPIKHNRRATNPLTSAPNKPKSVMAIDSASRKNMSPFDPLIKAYRKTKRSMATEKVTKVLQELEQYWEELGLQYFEHVLDYANCLLIYCEQLPHPETTFTTLSIYFCHYLAIDKYLLTDPASVERIDARYLDMVSRYLSKDDIEFYLYSYRMWVASCHDEAVLKKVLPTVSTAITRQFMWADWKNVNVALAPYVKLVILINFPDETISTASFQSSFTYIAIQVALLNDIASYIKDKDSNEVNYYLEADSGTIDKYEEIFEQSDRYLEAADLSNNIKKALRMSLHGSSLLFKFSERYYGKTESNW